MKKKSNNISSVESIKLLAVTSALKSCLKWMDRLRISGDIGNWEWDPSSEYIKAVEVLSLIDQDKFDNLAQAITLFDSLTDDQKIIVTSDYLNNDADRKLMIDALIEISEGKGRYSEDRLTHAVNTIQDLIGIAKETLTKINHEKE